MGNRILELEAQKAANPMTEDDFTKPGEMIPKDAGIKEFMDYNLAHYDSQDPNNLLGMMGMGSILKTGAKIPQAMLKGANQPSLFEALASDATPVVGIDDAAAAIKQADVMEHMIDHPQIAPKPEMSIDIMKQGSNIARPTTKGQLAPIPKYK